MAYELHGNEIGLDGRDYKGILKGTGEEVFWAPVFGILQRIGGVNKIRTCILHYVHME